MKKNAVTTVSAVLLMACLVVSLVGPGVAQDSSQPNNTQYDVQVSDSFPFDIPYVGRLFKNVGVSAECKLCTVPQVGISSSKSDCQKPCCQIDVAIQRLACDSEGCSAIHAATTNCATQPAKLAAAQLGIVSSQQCSKAPTGEGCCDSTCKCSESTAFADVDKEELIETLSETSIENAALYAKLESMETVWEEREEMFAALTETMMATAQMEVRVEQFEEKAEMLAEIARLQGQQEAQQQQQEMIGQLVELSVQNAKLEAQWELAQQQIAQQAQVAEIVAENAVLHARLEVTQQQHELVIAHSQTMVDNERLKAKLVKTGKKRKKGASPEAEVKTATRPKAKRN